MRSPTYRILINSSYNKLPKKAKHYVNRLVNKASKKPFVSTVLKGFYNDAFEAGDIDVLLSSTFTDADLFREVGCFWYLKTRIFLFLSSLLTGVTIPKLLKKNYCLFLQSLIIASYFVWSYVNESLGQWDYEE